jgi:membrane dipeptidase
VASLVKDESTNRHLPDRVIQALIEKDGVMGIVPHNPFLKAGWSFATIDGKSHVHLQDAVAHLDAVCQMAGDARHVAIGSDFDGSVGRAGVPQEIDTVADLQKIAPLLAEKGYSADDIELIFHKNWESILHRILP